MNKILKGIVTVVAPLILLLIGAQIMPLFESKDVLPTLFASRYLWGLLYYALLMAYLYWFCQQEYRGKEIWFLAVPFCCLLLFSLPYGWMWENSMTLFGIYLLFYPGYPVIFTLFFVYWFKLIGALRKYGRSREN